MEPRAVLSSLRAGWKIILLAIVGCAAIAFMVTMLMGPTYSTHMQFFVSTTDSATTSDAYQGGQLAQQRVASYTQLLAGDELGERVAERVGGAVTADRVIGDIAASTVTGTVLIDVTVADASRSAAEGIAAAVAEEFPGLVAELERAGSSDAPVVVTLTDRPGDAFTVDLRLRNSAFGALLGLLLGAVVAILRRLLDRTVRDKDTVEAVTGSTVAGIVFRDSALGERHTIDLAGDRTTEQYRHLATSLQYLDVDRPPKVIMIASALPGEGKTTTVINVALALAESGARVSVIEADLRRPKVTEYLGLVGGAGLTNVLAGNASVDEVSQTTRDGNLRVIAAGPPPPNPGRLLSSAQMAALLEKLREDNDYVLVDAAPLLPVADARGLARLMDGVLLCVRHGRTTRDQLAEASASVDTVGARTLGIILNMVPPRDDLADAHAYDSDYYGYTEPSSSPDSPGGSRSDATEPASR